MNLFKAYTRARELEAAQTKLHAELARENLLAQTLRKRVSELNQVNEKLMRRIDQQNAQLARQATDLLTAQRSVLALRTQASSSRAPLIAKDAT